MSTDGPPRLHEFLGDEPAPPPVLWHYTDAPGLKGIVEGGTFWATEATFMNDTAEVRHGLDLMAAAMDAYADDGLKATTRARVEGMRQATRTIYRPLGEDDLRPFVVCFCGDGDVLSQWRAYGGSDTAGGYALGFEAPEESRLLRLHQVVYDIGTQERACASLIDALVRRSDKNTRDVTEMAYLVLGFVNGVAEAATSFKDPAFSEEREWRLVWLGADTPDVQVEHRVSRGLVVPYIEIEAPRLVAVNCGPSPAPALKQAGVRSLLKANGLTDVTVEGSAAPLRV